MITKGALSPLSPRRGLKIWVLKSRSSEMGFPAFVTSKSVLFLLHLKIPVVVIVAVFDFL